MIVFLNTLFLKFPMSYGVICLGASGNQRLSTRSPGSSLEKYVPKHSGLTVFGDREETNSWISDADGQQSWSGWQYLASHDVDKERNQQINSNLSISDFMLCRFWLNTSFTLSSFTAYWYHYMNFRCLVFD